MDTKAVASIHRARHTDVGRLYLAKYWPCAALLSHLCARNLSTNGMTMAVVYHKLPAGLNIQDVHETAFMCTSIESNLEPSCETRVSWTLIWMTFDDEVSSSTTINCDYNK
ncbi:hypothetical protein J6590_099544, partial [Homalodisca vitripennis]